MGMSALKHHIYKLSFLQNAVIEYQVCKLDCVGRQGRLHGLIAEAVV